MTVDLPARAGQAMIVAAAPLANRVVGSAEGVIRPEMSGQGHGSRWCGGADDLAAPGKRSMQFHSDFEPNAATPINRDVPPAPCLLRPHGVPDQPAARRDHPRELGSRRLAPDDGERDALALFEVHGVCGHYLSSCFGAASPRTRRRASRYGAASREPRAREPRTADSNSAASAFSRNRQPLAPRIGLLPAAVG